MSGDVRVNCADEGGLPSSSRGTIAGELTRVNEEGV
jgi:hypothetical protein